MAAIINRITAFQYWAMEMLKTLITLKLNIEPSQLKITATLRYTKSRIQLVFGYNEVKKIL